MRNITIAAALTAVVVLAAATGAGAATVPSPSYTVAGFATFTPQGSTTSLTGFATGTTGDRGLLRASITSAPLATCSTLGSSCTLTGGTLGLTSSNRSQLTGTVTGGAIALVSQAPGCGRQQFTVDGTATSSSGDAITFDVVLTQFRLSFRGTCFAFPGATVAGSVTVGPVMGG